MQYFMVGSMGVLAAAGAKATVQDFLVNMSASADVLAMAKVEVDLAAIPEGKNVIIKWRGKPVFIRHRTEDEIKEAESVSTHALTSSPGYLVSNKSSQGRISPRSST